MIIAPRDGCKTDPRIFRRVFVYACVRALQRLPGVLFSFSASGGVFYRVLQPSRGSYYGNRLIFSLLCCYHPLGSLVVQGTEQLLKTIIAGNQLLNDYRPARWLQNRSSNFSSGVCLCLCSSASTPTGSVFSFSVSGGVFYRVLQPSRGSYYGNRLIFSLLFCYHPLGSPVV